MITAIKQCKGKDLLKIPQSRLPENQEYYASIKYDGHYTQIHKTGNQVRFFTSGGKEFYLSNIARQLISLNKDKDFILEAEYIYKTDGKLGSRGKAAKLTTYRTNYSKGITQNAEEGETFMVFDIITSHEFRYRLQILNSLNLGTFLKLVKTEKPQKLSTLKEYATVMANEGYEGLFLKTPDHKYLEGKRVNNAIKLKKRPTADLLCIGTEPGEGKYIGMIGSLILIDDNNRLVNVGSGLNDSERSSLHSKFINKIIEIEYEQILDTYIQPVYLRVREDKSNV